jgi:hypothetical protein
MRAVHELHCFCLLDNRHRIDLPVFKYFRISGLPDTPQEVGELPLLFLRQYEVGSTTCSASSEANKMTLELEKKNNEWLMNSLS